jgi:A/G-specific adenine glycosylase
MILSSSLLDWYDRHRRHLPWRAEPGIRPAPYGVWLSEIMLQQTTVQAVIPYYTKFLARWPTVKALASAPLDDVLTQWAGLGYYARARNLHACAKSIAEQGGIFPDSEAALLELPGIGAYTAAAIAAIAFDKPATVVDGNVERVMSRLHCVDESLPSAKKILKSLAADITPQSRPGDYAQAVMDLGATICTPRSPTCSLCPWTKPCQARAKNRAEDYPVKRAKAAKPTRYGTVFWLMDAQGRVLTRRRPESGLLGGMTEIPSTPWIEGRQWPLIEAVDHAPTSTDWTILNGLVRHTFTHFHLELTVVSGVATYNPALGQWHPPISLPSLALPTVMKKVIRLAKSDDL